MNNHTTPGPGGLASNTPRERHYSPSEFSAALAENGITLSSWSVRERCALPAADPLRVASNQWFPGRYYIPESELIRLVTNRRHE